MVKNALPNKEKDNALKLPPRSQNWNNAQKDKLLTTLIRMDQLTLIELPMHQHQLFRELFLQSHLKNLRSQFLRRKRRKKRRQKRRRRRRKLKLSFNRTRKIISGPHLANGI